jgi:hypothetical protein
MKIHASSAIENGFTSQLITSVTPMPRTWFLTWPRAAKSMRNSIGMIITQMSTPTGRLTCANSICPIACTGAGNSWPSVMPTTMHSATQTVR